MRAILVLAVCGLATTVAVADETKAVVREVSLKDYETNFRERGMVTKPTKITSADELAKALPGKDVPDGHTIRSPMVGTFYASPNPDAPAFVKVGQTVKAGDTLGIIEAMKMFNPIEADVSGTVRAILVKSGQPIEFDEPMFVIG